MTPVRTESASAAETEVLETPQSLVEALDTGFLPDDEHYRLTGEFGKTPPEKKDDKSSSAKPDASAASSTQETQEQDDARKAAASATAPTQRTEPGSQRRESRWEKRERELKDARAEIARLKAQPPQTQQRSEPEQPSQAATETQPQTTTAKPKIDDIDPKTKQPKFKTYAEYEDAKDAWLRQEAIREFREESSRTQQEQERAVVGKSLAENVTKVREAHSDYDQAVNAVMEAKEADGRAPIFYTPGSHIDNFMLSQPDRGAGLLYHCCKNVSDPAIREIFARTADGARYQLSNIEQISRLAVLAHSLAGKNVSRPPARTSQSEQQDPDELSSARPVTRASRPPHQVSGQGTVAKDAVEQALEDGDFETYSRTQNAKEIARQKRK